MTDVILFFCIKKKNIEMYWAKNSPGNTKVFLSVPGHIELWKNNLLSLKKTSVKPLRLLFGFPLGGWLFARATAVYLKAPFAKLSGVLAVDTQQHIATGFHRLFYLIE